MCLSTAYLNEKKEENIALRYVSQIRTEGDKVVLTDIMGAEKEIMGIVNFADLTAGFVIIKTEKVS